MDDQVIRLGFKVDTSAVSDARKATKTLRDEVYELGDVYEVTEAATREDALATRVYTAAMEEAEAATRKASAAAEEHGRAADEHRNKMAGVGQAALQSGRALQDFAQGGVGGILNNIEGLTASLGGGPGLAGVMTAVGLAAYFAIPYIKEFFAEAASNAIPETGDHLKDMEARLKDVTKQLGDLREKQKLTNDELAEYVRLAKEEAEAEKAVSAEKEQRQKLDALLKSQSKEARDDGSAFAAAVAGRGPEVQAALAAAMGKEAQARIGREGSRVDRELQKLFDTGISGDEFEKVKAQKYAEFEDWKRGQLRPEEDQRLAGDLMTRAAQGDTRAIARIKELATGGYASGGTLTKTMDAFRRNTPGYQQAQKVQDAMEKDLADVSAKGQKAAEKAAEEKAGADYDAEAEAFQRKVEGYDTLTDTTYRQRREARERKAKKDAAEAKREAEREGRDRDRTLTPEQVLESRATAEVMARTGVDRGEAAGAAKRAVDLMQQQWDAQSALGQSIDEMVATMQGNVAGWQALQARAQQATQFMREQQAQQQSLLRRGGW